MTSRKLLIKTMIILDMDEIKEKIERLKKFKQNQPDDKNEVAVVKEIKLKGMKVKIEIEADKNVNTTDNYVEKLIYEKDNNVFDIKHEATENKEKTCKNESHEEYKNEVN